MDDKKRAKLLRIRSQLQEAGLYNKPGHARLVCCQCKETSSVRTTTPQIYTPEVRASWKCWRCKADPKRKENPMAVKTVAKKIVVTSSDNPTPRTKTIKTITPSAPKAPATPQKSVDDLWYGLILSSIGKKKTDEELAVEMQKLNPTGKKYTAGDVKAHRSGFNCGRYACQKGIKPKVRAEEYIKETNGK